MNPFVLLTAADSWSAGLNMVPSSAGGSGSGGSSTPSFMGFTISQSGLETLGRWVRFVDIACVLVIIIGVIWYVSSMIGNSGYRRRKGTGIALTAGLTMVVMHSAIIMGCAYGQLGHGKLLLFLFTLASNLLFYAGSPLLYYLGNNAQFLSEMTMRPVFEREADRSYHFIGVVMAIGLFIFIMTGVM
ncbi:hypothetical protein FOD75_11520 (plasmid) [Limosilactobacillus reuteri]|uniref:Uncharacterized protein n=1 Tax=Limosilactobacillus reuteri TaxID=1598 RepID=A0A517D8M0_LIMRT|nr:hypothetical protein [Limosilactobacillus reuteri]QDR73710.1 hypothetical protein FOD75_11520 [Limosilactobacillus reuteri]